MQQYSLAFGFREPFQILSGFSPGCSFEDTANMTQIVDAALMETAESNKKNLIKELENVFGKIKLSKTMPVS